MTTMEKLFLQIIDRKDSIIEQLQHQADSYTQQLASRLLIDGITPPPWLLSPNSNPRSSNPNGLEKEDIISKLLLRPPRNSTQYLSGGHSLYYPPVAAGGNINKQLSSEKCIETHALNKAISLSNEHVMVPECHNNDIVGSLDHVPEVDDSAKSPQNEMDARISSIYSSHDMSLARIQRSKSRQKARELRTSGKATAKSCSSNETRTHLSFSGDSKSRKDFCQVIQDKRPLENEHKELYDGIMVEPTGDSLEQSCHVNDAIEGGNLGNVCLGSYASKKSTTGKTQGTQSQNNLFGRITRSRTSSQQTSGINKSSKLGTSVSCYPKGGGAVSRSVGDFILMYDISIFNKLSDAVETSQVVSDLNVETQAICSNEGVLKPVISSYIDMKESTLGVDTQENAETVVGNEPINEPIAMQPVNSGIMLDPVNLRQSSDCCKNVKPKQLNFDVINKSDLNESFSSHSKKRKLDGLLGKECSLSKGSASSIDHKSCQQSPKANVMSSSPETTRAHSNTKIDEFAKDEMKNIGLNMNGIDVVCEVSLSPKEVDKLDKEMHSEKSHLNEDQASSLNMQTKEDDIVRNDKESAAGVYIPELDDGAKSPQNEMNARITSISTAPDMSLARIQRSKSRQKARELRTGGKTTAKSYLSNETRTSYSRPAKSNSSYEIPSLQNEHKELDVGIMVEPPGDSLQQSCDANSVIEGVDLGDVCLGSYASKKSITEMTQGTQSQNNLCVRITRSRTSSQQTSGITKSSKPSKSVSCHPKDGGAFSHSVGDLMHEVSISNKLSDAAETSHAICSNEGVLKPSISSYIVIKESTLGVDHQENAEIVVGNEPVAMQPVNSGIKLDPVNLRQSSDCCKNAKPKQLNFDEIDECNLSDISSSLSKKRKLDGYPSKGSASSIDHQSSCSFFEQQSPKANVMSSSPGTARAHSYNKIDDIGVTHELNLSPKEVDDKCDKVHSEKSHLNEDQTSSINMQTKEDDIGHKCKEDAGGGYIPVSNIKSSFTSSLTKQGNKGSEDCLDKEVNKPEVDLDSSKAKEFELGTNAKLSNMKLNSAKVNTWPFNQQKNVEDQLNCFSDSRNFRVHIQRDAIHCDLETPESDLNLLKESKLILSSEKIHLTQLDGDKREHDEMMCDLSGGTESLLEIQAAEEVVTNVDDDTTETTDMLKQAEPICALNLIKDAADDSIDDGDVAATDNSNIERDLPEWVSSYGSIQSLQNDDKAMAVSNKITPVYEGFIIDEEIENVNKGNNESGIDLDSLDIPSTIIERASIIEQICKSASMQTPLPQFSSSFKHHQVQDLYGFIADEIFDEDSRKNLQTSDNGMTKIDSPFPHQQKLDYSTPFYFQSKNHYSSPVGKLWDRSYSSSGSSEIHLSSNPDLTCFPIEEDPCSNEENDDELVAEVQEPHIESHVSMSSMKYKDIHSSNSVSIEVSVPRTREKVKHKPKIPQGIKVSRYNEDNRNSSIVTRASGKGNVSVNSKNKSIMRSRIPSLSEKEAKRNNNIVSNITSFIPFVQQKQAAAGCTGKRNIKVKALEDAEAAKRLEQEKENERKLKKEALKLKRERIGKENAKEMERKLKMQEEIKKKEADMAARKRQREEEERKQLAKKRKLEAQKNQKLKCEKSRVKNAAMAGTKKNSENLRQNKNAAESSFQKQDITLTNDVQQVTHVSESHDVSDDCGEKYKATSLHETSPVKVVPVKLTNQENSYDISPYQCSDDEDDDDLPTKKFVPSWASKNRVAIVLPLQQKLDPTSIFPVNSFCSMNEVLLPRRLQAQ